MVWRQGTRVCIASGPLDGLNHTQAVNAVAELLSNKGVGEKRIQYRLRDWGISRQRFTWVLPSP